jgi:hypothetical protein
MLAVTQNYSFLSYWVHQTAGQRRRGINFSSKTAVPASSCAINRALALYGGSQQRTVLLPPPQNAALPILYRPKSLTPKLHDSSHMANVPYEVRRDMLLRHSKEMYMAVSTSASFSGAYWFESGAKSTILNSTWFLNTLQANVGEPSNRIRWLSVVSCNLQFTVFDAK